MQAAFIDSDDNSVEKRSELIKSELARFRLLKSKNNIQTNDENREAKPYYKTLTSALTSPVSDDTIKRSPTSVLQSAALRENTMPTSVAKYENRLAAIKRGLVTNTSSSTHNDASSGFSTDRDRLTAESPLTTSGRSSNQVTNPSKDKSPSLTRQVMTLSNQKKKPTSYKPTVPTSEEKRKETQWTQLENFIDVDIEKEIMKAHSQTTRHSSSHPSSFGSIPKSTRREAPEKRAVSAMDYIDKMVVEQRTVTPNPYKSAMKKDSSKKSLPGSPKMFESDELQLKKKGIMMQTPTQVPRINKDKQYVSFATNSHSETKKPMKKEAEVVMDDDVVREEMDKWRIFGKMMAESYEDLNRRYQDYMQEKDKDKKIIIALKDQVNTLKALLKASKEENNEMKANYDKLVTEASSYLTENNEKTHELNSVAKELELMRSECSEAKRIIEFMKHENEVLKQAPSDDTRQNDLVDHYQKLAELRFKECSALAEEIICLRTDLDRSHSNYLRIQREQSSGKKLNKDLHYSGKKLRQGGGDFNPSSFASGSGLKKTTRWSEQKYEKSEEDMEDLPPLPIDYKTLPVRQDTTEI